MKNIEAEQIQKNDEPLTRLRVGDVFIHDKIEQVVWFVNDSRAAIAPLNSPIKYRKREHDGKLQFLAKDNNSENISPNSAVKVLRSLGREGLAKYLDKRGESINETRKDNMAKTAKTKKEKGESTGKLGGYKGHSITSVIRAFGTAGWTLDEAREWFKQEKIDVADNTIKIQLRRGAKGEQEGAPLSKKELAEMKPEVEAKPEKKKSKKDKDKGGKKGKKKPAKEEDDEEAEGEDDEDEKPSKKEADEEGEEEEGDDE